MPRLATACLLFIALVVTFARAQGPGAPPPISLKFNPIVGGDAENATVILAHAPTTASGEISVQVTSSSTGVTIAPLTPASLSIKAPQTSVAFEIISSPVKSPEAVQIYACAPAPPSPLTCPSSPPGTMVTKADLLLGANGPASVSLNPATVNAGGSATGTVTLHYPAPMDVNYYVKRIVPPGTTVYVQKLRSGGATVALTSISGVTVNPSVTVPSGATTATFNVATSPSIANTAPASSCLMGAGVNTLAAAITATWEQSASGTLQIQAQTSAGRYTSKTIRIDPASLVGVSHDGLVVVLLNTQCSRMLKPGSVMFVDGLGVLDVGKIAPFPSSKQFIALLSRQQLADLEADKTTGTAAGGIALGVGPASLTDFINDGNLTVEFKKPVGVAEPGGGGANDPFADSSEPNSEQPPDETPWKYTTTGAPLSYSLTAFKNNKGLSGSVTAKGKITEDECDFVAVIHDDNVQEAKFTANMDGSVDVDWLAQVITGNDIGEARLRMRPLFASLVDDEPDGIPFLFHIDANLIFKPGFGEKAAAHGHFSVDFKGEGGIDGFEGINHALKATPDISSTTSTAKAPHGVVVAVNVPRFVLTFGTPSFLWATWNRMSAAMSTRTADFADHFEGQLGAHESQSIKYPDPKDYFKVKRGAFVQWAYSVAYAGAGLLALVPCQQYFQNYLVQAGIDRDMLGSISGSVPPEKGVVAYTSTPLKVIPNIQGCLPKK